MKWNLIKLVASVTLSALIIIEIQGRPSVTVAPLTIDEPPPAGKMVDSKSCKGVKCYEPPTEKKCAASVNSTDTTIGSCCPIYTCGSPEGEGQTNYKATIGNFPMGPPPGLGLPGPGSPNYQYTQQGRGMIQQNPGSFAQSQSSSYSYSTKYETKT